MLRKLATTLTLVLTTSLAIASSAFAVVPADSVSGSASAPATSTSNGFPWLDVSIGVVLAAVGIALLAAVALVSRNRRGATLPV
jgi:hypothetical protein